MTPFEEAGLANQDLFVCAPNGYLDIGTHVEVTCDDGSDRPKFKKVNDPFANEYWLPISCIGTRIDFLKMSITAIAKLQNKDEIDVVGALIEAEIIVDEQADELSSWFGG